MNDPDFDIFTSEKYLDGEFDNHPTLAPFLSALRSDPTPEEYHGEVAALAAFRDLHPHRFSGFMQIASTKVSLAAAVVAFVFTGAVAASVNGIVPRPLQDAASTALSKTAVVADDDEVSMNVEAATVYTWIEPGVGSVRYLATDARLEILEVASDEGVEIEVMMDRGLSTDMDFITPDGVFTWSAQIGPDGPEITFAATDR